MRSVFIPIVLLLLSCSAKITTNSVKKYPALDAHALVKVIGVGDTQPQGELLGSLSIGDTGFSTNCGYDVVIDMASQEARKIGGNIIKLTEHKLPNMMSSSCHRIKANIMRVENLEAIVELSQENTLGDVKYAILHVYRGRGAGSLVGYDLYLGDSVICRVKNNSKQSLKISKDGRNMLWAKTESKEEVPINVKFGNEYYLRCGIEMGIMVGRPSLQLVDYATGRAESEGIKVADK